MEQPSGARSIEAASTSTCIFVGDCERGTLSPQKIVNRGEYTRLFGGYKITDTGTPPTSPTLAYAMDAFFANGGQVAYILRTVAGKVSGADTALWSGTGALGGAITVEASSPGVWASTNQTLPAGFTLPLGVWVTFGQVVEPDGVTVDTTRFRLFVIYTDPSNDYAKTVVEDFDRLSVDPDDENYVVDVLKRSLFVRWTGSVELPALADIEAAGADPIGSAKTKALIDGAGGAGTATVLDYELDRLNDVTDASLLVLGTGFESDDATNEGLLEAGIIYVENRPLKDLFMVGGLARQGGSALTSTVLQPVIDNFGSIGSGPSHFAAVYWPWIQVADPAGVGRDPRVWVNPAASMAGLYARTDANRGVWKAPAGVEATVRGAKEVEYNVQDLHQDDLNPRGINALRRQPGAGLVSWGARTMVPSSEWRYINVRRMAIFLRISIYRGIQYAVFEGNDLPLWASLRLTIGNFMDGLYRQGAFAGGSPSEAFFVKVDSETTTEADQIAGVVNVLVGFSPLRPAEFVIVRLSQIVRSGA